MWVLIRTAHKCSCIYQPDVLSSPSPGLGVVNFDELVTSPTMGTPPAFSRLCRVLRVITGFIALKAVGFGFIVLGAFAGKSGGSSYSLCRRWPAFTEGGDVSDDQRFVLGISGNAG